MLKKWIVTLVCAGWMLLVAACGTTNNGTEVPIVPTAIAALEDVLPPDVALNLQNRVSEILGVPVESIQLNSIEQMDWPDGCLGLPEPDEACTDVITPGWLVAFTVDGQEYRFRVDQTGTVIRQEP